MKKCLIAAALLLALVLSGCGDKTPPVPSETEKPGEWISVDLGKVYAVWSVQINFGDIGYKRGGRDIDGAYRYLLEFSQDGKTWHKLVDRTRQTENRQHEYIEFKDKVGARYVRLTNKGPIPGEGKLAVTALRVFGDALLSNRMR